jgi:nicotinamide phosphoribosyltransferase
MTLKRPESIKQFAERVKARRNPNLILSSDSYKITQWPQYQPGTRRISSYAEARTNKLYPYLVNFGLQYYINEYLVGEVVTHDHILEADDICAAHFNDPRRKIFNRRGWSRLVDEFGGRLQLMIRGIDEGLRLPIRTPQFSITNTHDDFGWLTNPMETLLLKPWYTSTVATKSHFALSKIANALRKTTDDVAYIKMFEKLMLQDFGGRGGSSEETVCLGGMSHLVSGRGTDTIQAVRYIRDYYHHDILKKMPGYSVVAGEHSTITSWPTETESYENFFNTFPGQIISIVVDSYDQRNALENIFGGTLKQRVLDHIAGGGLVVLRLDSGIPEVEVVEAMKILAKQFGGKVNSKGFFELIPGLKILQGDGINLTSIDTILNAVIAAKFAVSNIACLGMGGALLQLVGRDDLGYALKCSWTDVNGVFRPVRKMPKTDPNKASQGGRLVVERHGDRIVSFQNCTEEQEAAETNMLKVRFLNGDALNQIDWDTVTANADIELKDWTPANEPLAVAA